MPGNNVKNNNKSINRTLETITIKIAVLVISSEKLKCNQNVVQDQQSKIGTDRQNIARHPNL